MNISTQNITRFLYKNYQKYFKVKDECNIFIKKIYLLVMNEEISNNFYLANTNIRPTNYKLGLISTNKNHSFVVSRYHHPILFV